MAVYPCDYGRHRYREPQQSLYWTEISEHLVSTYRMRLCPLHFDTLSELLENKMDDVDSNPLSSDTCEVCQAPRLMTQQARLFPAHKEERQLVIDVCAACASALGNEARVYNGELMPGR